MGDSVRHPLAKFSPLLVLTMARAVLVAVSVAFAVVLFGCGSNDDDHGHGDPIHGHCGDPTVHLDVVCHGEHAHLHLECVSQAACEAAVGHLRTEIGADAVKDYSCTVHEHASGTYKVEQMHWDVDGEPCPANGEEACGFLNMSAASIRACQGSGVSAKAQAAVEMV